MSIQTEQRFYADGATAKVCADCGRIVSFSAGRDEYLFGHIDEAENGIRVRANCSNLNCENYRAARLTGQVPQSRELGGGTMRKQQVKTAIFSMDGINNSPLFKEEIWEDKPFLEQMKGARDEVRRVEGPEDYQELISNHRESLLEAAERQGQRPEQRAANALLSALQKAHLTGDEGATHFSFIAGALIIEELERADLI